MVWSLVTFGNSQAVEANAKQESVEVSPFQSFKTSFATSFAALAESIGNFNETLDQNYGR